MAPNRTPVCVVAHPDDDSHGVAGRDRREWLGLPDGGVASLPFNDVVAMVERILVEERHSVVATFGPDGISGHPAHVTTSAATDAAFARVRGRSRSGCQRLTHVAVPQSVVDRWNRRRAKLGLFVFDPTEVYHLRGVPDERIGIAVDCRSVAGRIGDGLREHRTQQQVMSDEPDNLEQWDKRMKTTAMCSPGRRGSPVQTPTSRGAICPLRSSDTRSRNCTTTNQTPPG